jgi:ketosteroid isomerase-like protein
MKNEKLIQTVQQVYSDFGKQNLEGVLNALTDDVVWSDPGYPDVPYAKKRTGKHEVMNFFIEMGSTVTFTEFIPQEFYADGEVVIVKGFFAGKALKTDKLFESEWVMIWKFHGDKIYSYQAFVDTSKMANAIN